MHTYDPRTVLAAIDDHAVLVVGIGGLSIVAMFVLYYEAARMGARDRVYPMALWMCALWWPHDGSYLLRFDQWFTTYHHWFMELFWFAILVTFATECVFLAQIVRFGREELSPGSSPRVHALRVLGALAAGVVSWVLVKGALDDDLYLISFIATLLWAGPSASSVLMRHPDGRGTSVLEWVAYTVMAVFYSATSILFFGGGFFRSWPYVTICLAAVVWGVVAIDRVARTGAPIASWTPRRDDPMGDGQPSVASEPNTVALTSGAIGPPSSTE